MCLSKSWISGGSVGGRAYPKTWISGGGARWASSGLAAFSVGGWGEV